MIGKATTFLVVEDNDLDVEKITRGFERLKIVNYVTCVENGYEALDILRGTNGKDRLVAPYIILLDLNMPRMNGLEFLEALRADVTIANSPVFVLTTSARQKDVNAAYAFNVCGYIVKPVEMGQMLGALNTLNMYWNLCELPLSEAGL